MLNQPEDDELMEIALEGGDEDTQDDDAIRFESAGMLALLLLSMDPQKIEVQWLEVQNTEKHDTVRIVAKHNFGCILHDAKAAVEVKKKHADADPEFDAVTTLMDHKNAIARAKP